MENLTGILLNRHQHLGAGAKVDTELGVLVTHADWWRVKLLASKTNDTIKLFNVGTITIRQVVSSPSGSTVTASGGTVTVSMAGEYEIFFSYSLSGNGSSTWSQNKVTYVRPPQTIMSNLRAFSTWDGGGANTTRVNVYLLSATPPVFKNEDGTGLGGAVAGNSYVHFYVPAGSKDNYINNSIETRWAQVNNAGRLHEWKFTIID